MNQILTTIGFSANDGPQAESLCDWIYALNGKQPSGHCLIVAAADTYLEMRHKVRIAAEVAFETVSLTTANAVLEGGKVERVNYLFKHAADYIARHYRVPWVWVEPDCVPLVKDWREQLLTAYLNQPKRFMGPHVQFLLKDDKKILLARTSVYPPDAVQDISQYCNSIVPFEQLSCDAIVPRSTKGRLIQHMAYDGDDGKIRADAVMLHPDKSGTLIGKLRAKLPKELTFEKLQELQSHLVPIGTTFPGNGQRETEPKIDLRTKAGRALKAQQQAK